MKSLRQIYFPLRPGIPINTELHVSFYLLPFQIITNRSDQCTLVSIYQETGSFQFRHQRLVGADGTAESARLQTSVHSIDHRFPFRHIIRESRLKPDCSVFIRKQAGLPESYIREVPAQSA